VDENEARPARPMALTLSAVGVPIRTCLEKVQIEVYPEEFEYTSTAGSFKAEGSVALT
jgi:hypothetical protein